MDFTELNFTKLISAESFHIKEYDTNRLRNVKITGLYSFMPMSKVWL